MALISWKLVLFSGVSLEFKAKNILHYFKGVK